MKLIKNYLYNLIYQIFILIIPFITVPYISKVLGPYGVGLNAYSNSVVTYFILIGNLGVLTYGNRTIAYVREDSNERSRVFWEITLIRFLTVMLSCVLYLIYNMYAGEYRQAMLAQLPLLIASAFDISWFFMGLEKFNKIVIRNVAIKLLTLICIFTLVKTSDDYLLYIWILSVSQLIGNLFLWPQLKEDLTSVPLKEFKFLHHFAPMLAMFIPQVAIQVYVVLNKTMLGNMIGIESVGLFDNADKVIKLILAIVTATGVVMLPRVSNEFAKGNMKTIGQYLYYSLNFSSLIAFPLTVGIIAVSHDFSQIYFGDAFKGIDLIISILSFIIIAISWSNVLGNQFLLPLNRMRQYTSAVLFGAIANIILNFILIPQYAVIGASVASVVAELCVMVVQFVFVRRFLSLRRLLKDTFKIGLATVIMYITVVFSQRYFFGISGLLISIILGVVTYSCLILLIRPSIVNLILQKSRQILPTK